MSGREPGSPLPAEPAENLPGSADGESEAPRAGSLSAFHSRPFAAYWLGLLVSLIGARATQSANLWLLLQLTDSALLVGAVSLADAAAVLLLTPLGGIFADRLERRMLLQISQVVAILSSLALWGVTALGLVEPWHVYAATAVTSAALTFDLPVRQAIVPSLVPRRSLVSALTLSTPLFSIAGFVGPAIGGVLIAAAGGVATVYAFDVAVHLVLVVVLVFLKLPHATWKPDADRTNLVASFVEGVQYVRVRPVLWQLMVLDFVTTLFGAYRALLPIIARDILQAGPTGYGLLLSSISLGAVVGSAMMIRLSHITSSGRLVLLAVAAYAIVVSLLGHVPWFPVAVGFTALLGFLDAVGMTVRNTLVQLETPDELRGRVAAFGFMLARGGPAIGQALIGAGAMALGVPLILSLGASVPLVVSGGMLAFGNALRHYHYRRGESLGEAT